MRDDLDKCSAASEPAFCRQHAAEMGSRGASALGRKGRENRSAKREVSMPASQVVRALAALPCWWTLSLLFSRCAAQIRAARGNSFEELMTATLGLASTVKALPNAYGPHIIEANCPAEQLISGFAAEDGTEAKSRANKLLDDLLNDLHAFEGDEMRTWMRMAWILNPATLEGAWKDTARVERPQRPPMRERIAAALKTVGVMAEKGQDDNEFCIFAAWSIARALMTKAGPSPQTYDDDNAFASWGGATTPDRDRGSAISMASAEWSGRCPPSTAKSGSGRPSPTSDASSSTS
jgi:hypothetical protein